MDEARRKARLRLWLRSERALGLSSVRKVNLAPPAAAHAAGAAPSQAAQTGRAGLEAAKHDYGTPVAVRPGAGGTQAAPGPAANAALLPPDEPFTAPPLPREKRIVALRQMDENEVRGCTRCRLCESRTNTVFGEGDPEARIFFIGEGPGENEDLQGRPFVGKAGQLLDKMIAGMGLERRQVYIANIVKCRPPKNRAPVPDETAACTPFLERQLEIVRPEVIVTLGLPASQYMLKTKTPMGRLRGQWHTWRGIRLMPTFHPAYILRVYTPEVRGAVWSDLQQVMNVLGLKAPSKGRNDVSK